MLVDHLARQAQRHALQAEREARRERRRPERLAAFGGRGVAPVVEAAGQRPVQEVRHRRRRARRHLRLELPARERPAGHLPPLAARQLGSRSAPAVARRQGDRGAGERCRAGVPDRGVEGERLARDERLASRDGVDRDARRRRRADLRHLELLGDQLGGGLLARIAAGRGRRRSGRAGRARPAARPRPASRPAGAARLHDGERRPQVAHDVEQRRQRLLRPRRVELLAGAAGQRLHLVELRRHPLPPVRIGDRRGDRPRMRVDAGEQVLGAGAAAAGHPGDAALLRAQRLQAPHVL